MPAYQRQRLTCHNSTGCGLFALTFEAQQAELVYCSMLIFPRAEEVAGPRVIEYNRTFGTLSLLDLVALTPVMKLTSGSAEIVIGLIDGPVLTHHSDLVSERIRTIPGNTEGRCTRAETVACVHGTFIAGILCAKRDSAAPAICPGCTLLVRPIFPETTLRNEPLPSATPEELAAAIIECVDARARVVNLSAALVQLPSSRGERMLENALDYAAKRGVVVVVAAGNQGSVGSTVITRHPWVITVAACDLRGRPLSESNLGSSIGRRGLSAPGEGVSSLATEGKPFASRGTSVAAPFVTGAIALAWSEFPGASAARVRLAVTQAHATRPAVVPPLLNAWALYRAMAAHSRR
jgi:subtilisin family serine protease